MDKIEAPIGQDDTTQDQAPQGENLLHTGDDHAQDDADQSPTDDAAGAQDQTEADAPAQGDVQGDVAAAAVDLPEVDAHNAWCARMIADGWGYGATHDAANRTHPCLVSHANLPANWSVAEAAFKDIG